MLEYFKTRKFKLATLIGIMCFSLIAVLTATYCWYTSMHVRDTANGNFIASEVKEFEVSGKVFEYSEEKQTGVLDDTDPFILEAFDTYILTRNDYLAKIIEVTITFPEGESTGSNIVLSVPVSSGSTFSADGIVVDKFISNVIQFRLLPYSYTTPSGTTYYNGSFDTSSDALTYTNAKAKMDSDSTTYKPYTVVPSNYYTSSNKKNLTKSTLTFDSFTIPTVIDSAVFYLEFDYCKSYIEQFIEINDNAETPTAGDISQVKEIVFTNDLLKLNVSSRG